MTRTRPLRRSRRRRPAAGFTLIEIMLVVMIIVVLVGAAVYGLRGNLEFAKEERARADIQTISTQLKLYETMNYFLPSTEQGIKALVSRPGTEPVPQRWRQLLEKEPIDPWGMKYGYRSPGKRNPQSFDLFSLGPDRVESDDDVGNW